MGLASDFQAEMDRQAAAAAAAAGAQQQPTGATNVSPGGGQQQPVPAQQQTNAPPSAPQPSGWSNWMPSAQTVTDVANRLGNDILLGAGDPITAGLEGVGRKFGQLFDPSVPLSEVFNPATLEADLPRLRAQREAMNARMSPAAKATADIAAQFTPTGTAGSKLPYVGKVAGPVIQGAGQEALRAYNEGRSWPDIANAAWGGATAGAAAVGGGALVSPKLAAQLAAMGVREIPTGALGYLGHTLGLPGGGIETAVLGHLVGEGSPFEEGASAIRKWGAGLPDWSVTRQALQNLILGVGSSSMQQSRDQQR